MDRVETAIEAIIASVPADKKENRAEVARQARMLAKITCRELGGALGLTLSQVSDIEHGRLAVDDDVITAIVMVCGSKIVVDYFFNKRP
jgi:hypothetical protein